MPFSSAFFSWASPSLPTAPFLFLSAYSLYLPRAFVSCSLPRRFARTCSLLLALRPHTVTAFRFHAPPLLPFILPLRMPPAVPPFSLSFPAAPPFCSPLWAARFQLPGDAHFLPAFLFVLPVVRRMDLWRPSLGRVLVFVYFSPPLIPPRQGSDFCTDAHSLCATHGHAFFCADSDRPWYCGLRAWELGALRAVRAVHVCLLCVLRNVPPFASPWVLLFTRKFGFNVGRHLPTLPGWRSSRRRPPAFVSWASLASVAVLPLAWTSSAVRAFSAANLRLSVTPLPRCASLRRHVPADPRPCVKVSTVLSPDSFCHLFTTTLSFHLLVPFWFIGLQFFVCPHSPPPYSLMLLLSCFSSLRLPTAGFLPPLFVPLTSFSASVFCSHGLVPSTRLPSPLYSSSAG